MNGEQGAALNLETYTYEPKAWNELDVDIKISHSSICGSCIHTITNGWKGTKYPVGFDVREMCHNTDIYAC